MTKCKPDFINSFNADGYSDELKNLLKPRATLSPPNSANYSESQVLDELRKANHGKEPTEDEKNARSGWLALRNTINK